MAKTKQKQEKNLCVDNIRHSEYYGMQEVLDKLYEESKNGKEFTNLMDYILSKENILLAYRNIKTNGGSKTPGTDKITIEQIGKLTPEELVEKVRFIVKGSKHGYRPKLVRRKEIPKPNGKTRPLGIPCMWDRIVQQCIKQIMEPICEAKFSNNSYGFRPNRSAEHAIAATYKLMQVSHLNWVIEFDIEGFFDNVNHSKLIKQIWAMGIHDKHLIYVIKQILKAPIKMPNGNIIKPEKGTPQGGIISPLLANIVLNELDQWIDSQWQKNPVIYKYQHKVRKNGAIDFSSGYRTMRLRTNLKEMLIIRYADDFRIFCRTEQDAKNTMIAITEWLDKRLKLKVSQEKTRIVNAKLKYMEFLGFKIKLHKKGQKYVVRSRMSDKALERATKELVGQTKNIAAPRRNRTEKEEILIYNSKVMGIQNYYQIATEINKDGAIMYRRVMVILTNRLRTQKGTRLKRKGRKLRDIEEKRYGKSLAIRYVAGTEEPIYPVGYVRHKNPLLKRRDVNSYTPEGREAIHDNLRIDKRMLLSIMTTPSCGRSAEYMDNRISLFSAQFGKCVVTGREFETVEEIHCHHKVPRNRGGTDKYSNLCLVHKNVHKLIHARKQEVIEKYIKMLELNTMQINKVNKLREVAGIITI